MQNKNLNDIVALDNVYFCLKEELGYGEHTKVFKPYDLKDVTDFTLVYYQTIFECQDMGRKDNDYKYNFYIHKYNKLLLLPDLYDFIVAHPNERFMMIKEREGTLSSIKIWVTSKPNDLTVSFFAPTENGNFELLARIHNKYGKPEWDPDRNEILSDRISAIIDENSYYYSHVELKNKGLILSNPGYGYNKEITGFTIFGSTSGGINSNNIMGQFINIPGKTRIVADNSDYKPSFNISIGTKCFDSVQQRYGLNDSDMEKRWYRSNETVHPDEVFPSADLDPETYSRIEKEIKSSLLNGDGKGFTSYMGYGAGYATYYMDARIVITAPVAGHRRPTFHYICGFMNSEAIDIVELARGELLMKDMTPVTIYYLRNNGDYVKISHNRYGQTRDMIVENGKIDAVTLSVWTEEKSLHPELMRAVIENQDKVGLDVVKKFNTLKFGALFIEQLIKNSQFELASSFTNYINGRADDLNYVCNSLNDLLPGCNPDGTSVLNVLNISKPMSDLINELLDEYGQKEASSYIDVYKAVRRLCPTNILSKKESDLIRKYVYLLRTNHAIYRTTAVTTTDIIGHPDEIKSLYKMFHKIKERFEGTNYYYDILRKYEEIVLAYFKLKEYGWDPDAYKIFIEFSLNGNFDDVAQMVSEREEAANTALKILQDKIDAIAREKVEASYASRKRTLKKLESVEPKKKVISTLLRKYSVIMPSQIYGEDVPRSIEKEGFDQQQCVYRAYADKIARGEYTVMYLRLTDNLDEALVTIGITDQGRINQTYGYRNSIITKEQAMAITEWAQTKSGLLTFKSEHTNVTPSGWPSDCAVPNLPEPSAEWIEKLKKVNPNFKVGEACKDDDGVDAEVEADEE